MLVLLNATRICFFIYQTRASFLLGASYCIITHTEILEDVDQESFEAIKLFLRDQSTPGISHREKYTNIARGCNVPTGRPYFLVRIGIAFSVGGWKSGHFPLNAAIHFRDLQFFFHQACN